MKRKEYADRGDFQRNEHADRIRKLRRAAGYTQAELAPLIGISEGLIKRMEAGLRNLTPENAKRYADFFQCDPAYLTGASDYMDPLDRWEAEHPEGVKRQDYELPLAIYLAAVMPPDKLAEAYSEIGSFIDETVRKYGGRPADGAVLEKDI